MSWRISVDGWLRAVLLFLAVCAVGTAVAQEKTVYDDYITRYARIAVSHQQRFGIPASITLAQGLLESGAGKSRLASVGNNHFGIKCHSSWSGERIYEDDDELNECFRKYTSAEESFEDHARFLKKKRYAPLFLLDVLDYKSWARALKKCGYATDPAYPDKLIALIETYHLYEYDSGQPVLAQREDLSGDETIEHDIEASIVSEIVVGHQIKRKWGLHYVIVRNGDSIESIAGEFGLSMERLLTFNDMDANYTELRVGEMLYLQEKNRKCKVGAKEHIVEDGETLHSVSQRYGVRLKDLLKKNKLKTNSVIVRDQVLLLP